MKLPIKIQAQKYHDPETGKPIGEDYHIIGADGIEIGYIDDDKDAAEIIVAAVNACAGLTTESLEFAAAENLKLDFQNRIKNLEAETARLREENERLREALEFVANVPGGTIGSALTLAKDTARAALSETAPTPPPHRMGPPFLDIILPMR